MNLQETGWRVWGMAWIDMSQDREKFQAFMNETNNFLVS